MDEPAWWTNRKEQKVSTEFERLEHERAGTGKHTPHTEDEIEGIIERLRRFLNRDRPHGLSAWRVQDCRHYVLTMTG